ncbi:MAG TPA: outer membrane lipoprotein-sorting protein [Candidatus Limnocylindrales bacterium]|nr:outer membrane lipoprotein-sorting protein [Candidatus Limnocylindrales bacterium]
MKVFQLSPATEWRPKVAHGETVGFVVNTNEAPERGGRNFWRSTFCRSFRGLKFFFASQPTVSPWATFCRASGALVALILFFAVGATAETTNTLSDAEIQGRNLALQLCNGSPAENLTNIGHLKVDKKNSSRINVSVTFETFVSSNSWICRFRANLTNEWSEEYQIYHKENLPNIYVNNAESSIVPTPFSDSEKNISFARSDFWLADLGLEFFYWPAQKILPTTTTLKRGRSYTLLESTNPDPSTNGYSRVLSWIDKESGGILEAEAYDVQGKLLKEFAPKSFKKVNGQWELQEMEIRNVQTGSRTRLEFDLKK